MKAIETVAISDDPMGFEARRIFAQGFSSTMTEMVQRESMLQVNVNDVPTLKMGCSASHLTELVVGRLFTEGIIESSDDIASIKISEEPLVSDVRLEHRIADFSRMTLPEVPTASTHAQTLNGYFVDEQVLSPVEPIFWSPEWVFRVAKAFEKDRTSHSMTFGTHSCYLANHEHILYCREDIGRHNAFDKAIGSALMDGIDLTQCLIFTSGRVPTDMVRKAIRARVPILVSKAVATDKTIAIARDHQLTLICSAHTDSMVVLNDPLSLGLAWAKTA